MLVKFKYSAKDESTYSVFVDSEELNNAHEYECFDDMQDIRIKVVQRNFLNCPKNKFITVLKVLCSLFLYGENDYYAPYYTVSECLITPSKNPLICIEQKNGKIIFKNEIGEKIESSCTFKITRKSICKYIFICVIRAFLIALLLIYSWYYMFNADYLKGSAMPYFVFSFLILFAVYSLIDIFSVLFRSLLLTFKDGGRF